MAVTEIKNCLKVWVICFAIICTFFPEIAATSISTDFDNGFGGTMCALMRGADARPVHAITVVAIFMLGISAFFGKLTWNNAILHIIASIIITNAGQLMSALDGGPC